MPRIPIDGFGVKYIKSIDTTVLEVRAMAPMSQGDIIETAVGLTIMMGKVLHNASSRISTEATGSPAKDTGATGSPTEATGSPTEVTESPTEDTESYMEATGATENTTQPTGSPTVPTRGLTVDIGSPTEASGSYREVPNVHMEVATLPGETLSIAGTLNTHEFSESDSPSDASTVIVNSPKVLSVGGIRIPHGSGLP